MKIAIWGMGKFGKELVNYIQCLNNVLKENGFPNIECKCFIDSFALDDSYEEKGMAFCRPEKFVKSTVDVVVVAVKKYEGIIHQLIEMGINTNSVIVYNPKFKMKFLYDLDTYSPTYDFRAMSEKYRQMLDYVKKYDIQSSHEDQNVNIEQCKAFEILEYDIAALEEVGNKAYNEKLYKTLYKTNGLARKNGKTIGIYYTRFHNGGIERVIAQLMPIFLKMGHRVVLITEETCFQNDEYVCPKEVIRVYLPGINSDRFDWYLALKNIIEKYDIACMYLHDYSTYTSENMVFYYLRKLGLKIIVHIHNYYKYINVRDRLLPAYHLADLVVVLSREDEEFWQQKGVRAKYIPNPVNLTIPYMYHERIAERPTILWIGRIEQAQKQIYDVVDIMRELIKLIPDACLKIVGKADDDKVFKELQHRIKSVSLENNIFCCGFRLDPWEEAREVDVFLLTSAYEGFSMVLMESKMAGLPLVTYSMPYLELLKDGKGYVAVKQRDTAGAAKEVARIIQNKDLQKKMSKEARESIEVFAGQDLEKIWYEVL